MKRISFETYKTICNEYAKYVEMQDDPADFCRARINDFLRNVPGHGQVTKACIERVWNSVYDYKVVVPIVLIHYLHQSIELKPGTWTVIENDTVLWRIRKLTEQYKYLKDKDI